MYNSPSFNRAQAQYEAMLPPDADEDEYDNEDLCCEECGGEYGNCECSSKPDCDDDLKEEPYQKEMVEHDR